MHAQDKCLHDEDVNEDYELTLNDVILALKKTLNVITLNEWQFSCADINTDNNVNLDDLICIFEAPSRRFLAIRENNL